MEDGEKKVYVSALKAIKDRRSIRKFMRLWLRNSGYALRQPRHDGAFHLIE